MHGRKFTFLVCYFVICAKIFQTMELMEMYLVLLEILRDVVKTMKISRKSYLWAEKCEISKFQKIWEKLAKINLLLI